jgi:ribosome-associated protein
VTARELALRAAAAAIAKQGIEPVLLDVSGKAGYTDFILVVSGRSDRHVEALADAVQQDLGRTRVRPLGVEGAGGRWLLLDYGDLVVHVFYPSVREFYDLEALWADAPQVPLDVPPEQRHAAEIY